MSRWVVSGLLVCLGGLLIVGWMVHRRSRAVQAATSETGNAPGRASPAVSEFAQFLETERRLDRIAWSEEILSDRYEELVNRLWDRARVEGTPFPGLREMEVRELQWPRFGPPERLEHAIERRRQSGTSGALDRGRFLDLVTRWETGGVTVEQLEIRHRRYGRDDAGRLVSVFQVRIHADVSGESRRLVCRGDVVVTWNAAGVSENRPVPDVVGFENLEWLERAGAPPFDHVIPFEMTPQETRAGVEPNLQAIDLNGDGLSEIIASRVNRVYWNRGQGRFASGSLIEGPVPCIVNGVFGDFTGDGDTDFLAACQGTLNLYPGDATGRFSGAGSLGFAGGAVLVNPSVLVAGDLDADGDLDLWLGQYKSPYRDGQMPTPFYDANDGYPSFLLINDGHGRFEDRTAESDLASSRFRRTYSASFIDLDNDVDLDLVTVSDFAGVGLYLNGGDGRFSDVTDVWVKEPRLFGMAHGFGDYDGDGQMDMLVIGMDSPTADRMDALGAVLPDFPGIAAMRTMMARGNLLLAGRDGRLVEMSMGEGIVRSGWAWGTVSADFDNDGDLDVYVANGHISGEFVRDYETEFWRHDIFLGDSTEDEALDRFFTAKQQEFRRRGGSYGGHEINRFYLNLGGREFVEVGYLMGVSLGNDSRNVVADDFDGDGAVELLVGTFESWPRLKQEVHLFPNFFDTANHWIGALLPGAHAIGANVRVVTASGEQYRWIVTGDSYRSQHAFKAHFGLGANEAVERLVVTWPDGSQSELLDPEIDRYHRFSKGVNGRGLGE